MLVINGVGLVFKPDSFVYSTVKGVMGLGWWVAVILAIMWWNKNKQYRLQYQLNPKMKCT